MKAMLPGPKMKNVTMPISRIRIIEGQIDDFLGVEGWDIAG